MAFATQHHSQRTTIMTNPMLIGDFAAAQEQLNAATLVYENVCADRAIEMKWCGTTLEKGNIYAGLLHTNPGHVGDDHDDELFGSDLVNGQLTESTLLCIASKK